MWGVRQDNGRGRLEHLQFGRALKEAEVHLYGCVRQRGEFRKGYLRKPDSANKGAASHAGEREDC